MRTVTLRALCCVIAVAVARRTRADALSEALDAVERAITATELERGLRYATLVRNDDEKITELAIGAMSMAEAGEVPTDSIITHIEIVAPHSCGTDSCG